MHPDYLRLSFIAIITCKMAGVDFALSPCSSRSLPELPFSLPFVRLPHKLSLPFKRHRTSTIALHQTLLFANCLASPHIISMFSSSLVTVTVCISCTKSQTGFRGEQLHPCMHWVHFIPCLVSHSLGVMWIVSSPSAPEGVSRELAIVSVSVTINPARGGWHLCLHQGPVRRRGRGLGSMTRTWGWSPGTRHTGYIVQIFNYANSIMQFIGLNCKGLFSKLKRDLL